MFLSRRVTEDRTPKTSSRFSIFDTEKEYGFPFKKGKQSFMSSVDKQALPQCFRQKVSRGGPSELALKHRGPPCSAPDCHRGSDERSASRCPGIQIRAEVHAMFELRPLIRNVDALMVKLVVGVVLS